MNQDAQLIRAQADFNGLFNDLLCLSHEETCLGEDGQPVVVCEGMTVIAFEDDLDEHGEPDSLIASGTVERAPGAQATVYSERLSGHLGRSPPSVIRVRLAARRTHVSRSKLA